ncbi:MAG: hypothetical protein NZ585_05315 [Chloracidobacterium sp.]|nr:hypothetical protein [Chloracidobacterium sp.]MDW8216887.1 hypothetical protein [Acidobacteriota bacterium]
MKIRPGSPFGSSPTSSESVRGKKRSGGIFGALVEGTPETVADETSAVTSASSPARSALAAIAAQSNLSNPEEATAAVRQSAHSLLTLSFSDAIQSSPLSGKMADDLAELAAGDPRFRRKMLSILSRLKTETTSHVAK